MAATSKAGRKKEDLTKHALSHFKGINPELNIVGMDINYPAAIDYFIIKGDELTGIVEFRVREDGIDLKSLKSGREMILSVDKYNKCIYLADMLGKPVYFWVYLPKDNCLISWQLHNPSDGTYINHGTFNFPTRRNLNDVRKQNKPCITLNLKDGRIISADIPGFA